VGCSASARRWFWGQLRKRGTGVIAMMIVSIGLALVLRNVTRSGSAAGPGSTRTTTPRAVDFGPFTANWRRWPMAVCIVVILAIVRAVFARLGKATRAVADNPSLAAPPASTSNGSSGWCGRSAPPRPASMASCSMSQESLHDGDPDPAAGVRRGHLGGLGTAFGARLSVRFWLVCSFSFPLWLAEELKIASALFL
jgi:branched-chain amino acid transport system permease protein